MSKPDAVEIVGPAIQRSNHIQDREISTVAGAPKAWRRLDGLAWLMERKAIAGHQRDAGRRLQEDYELSQMQGGARSGGERTSGRSSYEIPDSALDAKDRVKAALSVVPPELVSMTVLFLLPDFEAKPFSLERIATMVREDKRSISLGVRAALSLLARHYGN